MNPQNDHDLLIRVDENVKNLVQETRSLRDDSNRRIHALETGKLDMAEFDRYRTLHITELDKLRNFIEKTLADRKTDEEKEMKEENGRVKELQERISKLEKIAYIGMGALGLIQFIVGLIK